MPKHPRKCKHPSLSNPEIQISLVLKSYKKMFYHHRKNLHGTLKFKDGQGTTISEHRLDYSIFTPANSSEMCDTFLRYLRIKSYNPVYAHISIEMTDEFEGERYAYSKTLPWPECLDKIVSAMQKFLDWHGFDLEINDLTVHQLIMKH